MSNHTRTSHIGGMTAKRIKYIIFYGGNKLALKRKYGARIVAVAIKAKNNEPIR